MICGKSDKGLLYYKRHLSCMHAESLQKIMMMSLPINTNIEEHSVILIENGTNSAVLVSLTCTYTARLNLPKLK